MEADCPGRWGCLPFQQSHLPHRSICKGQSQSLPIFRRAEKPSRLLESCGNWPNFQHCFKKREVRPRSPPFRSFQLVNHPFLQLLIHKLPVQKGASSHSGTDVQRGLLFQPLRKDYPAKSNLVLTYAFALCCINGTHRLTPRVFEEKSKNRWICPSSAFRAASSLRTDGSPWRSFSTVNKVSDREELHANQNKAEQPALICKRAPLVKKWWAWPRSQRVSLISKPVPQQSFNQTVIYPS